MTETKITRTAKTWRESNLLVQTLPSMKAKLKTTESEIRNQERYAKAQAIKMGRKGANFLMHVYYREYLQFRRLRQCFIDGDLEGVLKST